MPGLQAAILVWVSSYTAVCEVLSKHTFRNFSAISIMTPEQVYLIRQSFDAIWPVRRKLAVTFYRRFFELAPDAHNYFPAKWNDSISS